MKLPAHLTIQNGHLHIGGHDCVSLAEKYGTPLYVTSEDRIANISGTTRRPSLPGTIRCRCSLRQRQTATSR